MLSRNAHTIQEHQEIVGSRFQLVQIIRHRTRQLMNGAPIRKGIGAVGSEFNPDKRSEIPNHRFPKIALEELRQGKLQWRRVSSQTPEEMPLIEDNPIVFGE
jgi:DNA-directed RNA polymerase omega subunit